jgi:hypothetical protein
MAELRADKRIEGNFSQGWPFALFITALAVGAFVTAGLIHKATFRSPNDVTAEYRKESAAVTGADSASKPAGEH